MVPFVNYTQDTQARFPRIEMKLSRKPENPKSKQKHRKLTGYSYDKLYFSKML